MKKLTEIELKLKTITYLNNKGMQFVLENGKDVVWNYSPFYSNFRIRLSFQKKDYNDLESKYIINYYVNVNVKGTRRRKTTTNDGYNLKVYKNLLLIKEELDKIASAEKEKIDTKTKYCTELEKYYKKLYETVTISTYREDDTRVSISINCHKPNKSVYYEIIYKNNRYFLSEKKEVLNSTEAIEFQID